LCKLNERIGFIGLGIMGSKMAVNLVNAGLTVIAYDINSSAMKRAEKNNIKIVYSVEEVIREAEIIITMLPDSPQVEEVVYREKGLLNIMKPGNVLIDMSTISISSCKKIAHSLQERQIDFLDAPVTGGEEAAKKATLSIFVGGQEKLFKRMLPLFRSMGERITLMGDTGSGQIAKICNQIVGAVTLQAVCEGMILAAKIGIDIKTLIAAMKGGAADSFMLDYVTKRILENDFSPGFKITLEQKDLRNALAAADDVKVSLPGLALVHQLYKSREAAACAETEGNQALFRVYEQLSSFTLNEGSTKV
jgi:2-hydroxy-3-oxopropionate reductase